MLFTTKALNWLLYRRTHKLSPHTCILGQRVGLRSVEPHLFASAGHIWTRQCKGHLDNIWSDSVGFCWICHMDPWGSNVKSLRFWMTCKYSSPRLTFEYYWDSFGRTTGPWREWWWLFLFEQFRFLLHSCQFGSVASNAVVFEAILTACRSSLVM